jgi:hypothetical protein
MRCATLTRDNVAALPRASSLGCTPKCLGATINSDRSLALILQLAADQRR